MRYIRYAVIATFAVALIIVSLANGNLVTLKLLPDELAGVLNFNAQIDLPLYVVIFGGIILGLIVGFAGEWLREHTVRVEASQQGREVRRLQRENRRLRSEKEDNQGDEVLAILDEAR